MGRVVSIDVALAEEHVGSGHAQNAGFDTFRSLDNRAQCAAGGLGARKSMAVACVVKNNNGVGMALIGSVDAVKVLEFATEVRPRHAISSGSRRSRRRRWARDGGRHVARG